MLWKTLLYQPQSLVARRLIFLIHRWTGIGIGLYVILISVTGAVLVFREEIERWQYPELFRTQATGPHAEIWEVMRSVQIAYPNRPLIRISAPTPARPVFLAFMVGEDDYLNITLDPVTAMVLGELPERSFLIWLLHLHGELTGGRTGRFFNGIGSLLLFLMSATGLLIWWPGVYNWRGSLTVDFRKHWKRLNWSLHSSVGFWTLSFLLMWSVTGVYFSWPRQVRAALNRLSPVTYDYVPQSRAIPQGDGSTPELAALIEKARQTVPGSRIVAVKPSNSPASPITVELTRTKPDSFPNTGDVYVYFDRTSGEMLHMWDRAERTLSDGIMSWIEPIHFGRFGGVGTKVAWFILGLCPAVLAITGAVIWINRAR